MIASAYRLLRVLPALLLLAVSVPGNADQTAVLEHVEKFRDGSSFFQREEYRKAALAWSNVGASLAHDKTDKKASLAAAFASVIASIAYERAEDAMAYSEWGSATRYYMQAGTAWASQRQLLFDYLTEVKEQLSLAASEDNGVYVDTDLQFFLALDTLVGYTVFDKPGSGLKVQDVNREQVLTENRHYFARPLSVVQGDDSVAPMTNDDEVTASLYEQSDLAVDDAPVAAVQEQPLQPGADAKVFTRSELEADDLLDQDGVAGNAIVINPAALPAVVDALVIKTQPKVVARDKKPTPVASSKLTAKAPPTKRGFGLSAAQSESAKRAWSYFERNVNEDTGLVNSAENHPVSTAWDMGSQLAGVISAHQMELIDDDQFAGWMDRSLAALTALPLYGGTLPNHSYNTLNARMLDSAGAESRVGSGWSAIDNGRLLIWLRILSSWYPEYTNLVYAVVARWEFSSAVSNLQLNSMTDVNGEGRRSQEGRLGYEQYAAAGYSLWGLDVSRALGLPPVDRVGIHGVEVMIDRRPASSLSSDGFALAGIELGGINDAYREVSKAVYQAQRQRWLKKRKLTAMGEDRQHPSGKSASNLVYQSDSGVAFGCVGPQQQPLKICQSVSSKIAYAWDALYADKYTVALLSVVEQGIASSRGYYSGIYDDFTVNRSISLETNAMVLESMLMKYRRGAPFIQPGGSRFAAAED